MTSEPARSRDLDEPESWKGYPFGYEQGRADALREVEEALLENANRAVVLHERVCYERALRLIRDRFRAGGERRV